MFKFHNKISLEYVADDPIIGSSATYFNEIFRPEFVDDKISVCSSDGLMTNKQQAITGTNDDKDLWRHVEALDHNELTVFSSRLIKDLGTRMCEPQVCCKLSMSV